MASDEFELPERDVWTVSRLNREVRLMLETGLRFEQIASTRRYCVGAMDLEGAVLEMLAESAEFRMSEGRLVLMSDSGEPLAAFEASEREATEPE